MHIDRLDLTDATRGVLRKQGIETLSDLLEHSEDYTKIKGVGKNRSTELQEAIAASEIGAPGRFDAAPREDPPPEEAASATSPFGKAQPGDLVIFTSEHGRNRYARLGAVDENGKGSLTVFAGSSRYNEDGVPYNGTESPFTWRQKPTEEA